MSYATSPLGHKTVHQICQRIAEKLIARHNWTVLSPEELVKRVQHALQPTSTPTDIEQMVKNVYTTALYDACRQRNNPDIRERAYSELSRYLYRAAFRRWPEHAEDITQQALLRIHQRIDQCRQPERFRAFAVYMLLWARKELAGKLPDDTGLDQADDRVADHQQDSIDTMLIGDERLQVLVEALGRLTDERRRKVVFLKFFWKASDAEIGEQLGMTVGHVRVLRNRALNQLRDDPVLHAYFTSDDAPLKKRAA